MQDQRSVKEPSRFFESMVVVGLHPNTNIQALQKQIYDKKSDGSKKLRTAPSFQHRANDDTNLEPQVLNNEFNVKVQGFLFFNS